MGGGGPQPPGRGPRHNGRAPVGGGGCRRAARRGARPLARHDAGKETWGGWGGTDRRPRHRTARRWGAGDAAAAGGASHPPRRRSGSAARCFDRILFPGLKVRVLLPMRTIHHPPRRPKTSPSARCWSISPRAPVYAKAPQTKATRPRFLRFLHTCDRLLWAAHTVCLFVHALSPSPMREHYVFWAAAPRSDRWKRGLCASGSLETAFLLAFNGCICCVAGARRRSQAPVRGSHIETPVRSTVLNVLNRTGRRGRALQGRFSAGGGTRGCGLR